MLSVALWGLVAAKAKQGMSAVSEKDPETVRGMLKKATNLIVLICFASLVKFGAEITNHSKAPNARHHLKAARPSTFPQPGDAASPFVEHTASFYDPTSSHYMGGAHNVALAHLSDPDNTMFAATPNVDASPYEALIENKHYEKLDQNQDTGINH